MDLVGGGRGAAGLQLLIGHLSKNTKNDGGRAPSLWPGVGGLSTSGGGVDTALWLDPPPPPPKGSIDRHPKILPRLIRGPRR